MDFYNLGPNWTMNWLTYITDDPTMVGTGSTIRYLPTGGFYTYNNFDTTSQRFPGVGAFDPQDDDGSYLVLTSTNPITYTRFLRDGGREIYSQSDGAMTAPRNILLSTVIDPRGNAVTLNYDSSMQTNMRLKSLTDATGRKTIFYYADQSPGSLSVRLALVEPVEPACAFDLGSILQSRQPSRGHPLLRHDRTSDIAHRRDWAEVELASTVTGSSTR